MRTGAGAGMSVSPHRVSDGVDQASNMALERSAGSPSLAAAAHRRRRIVRPHGKRLNLSGRVARIIGGSVSQ